MVKSLPKKKKKIVVHTCNLMQGWGTRNPQTRSRSCCSEADATLSLGNRVATVSNDEWMNEWMNVVEVGGENQLTGLWLCMDDPAISRALSQLVLCLTFFQLIMVHLLQKCVNNGNVNNKYCEVNCLFHLLQGWGALWKSFLSRQEHETGSLCCRLGSGAISSGHLPGSSPASRVSQLPNF